MKTFKKIKKNKGGFTHTLNFSKRSLVCGFTLVETMVAIFILSMALTALLGLISSSLFYSRYSRNEITANYLLQEVVDSIRNKRDSYILSDPNPAVGWDSFVSYSSNCSTWCLFDAKTGNVQPMNSSDDEEMLLNYSLNYDESARDGSFYGINGAKSNFARRVVVTNTGTGDEVDVTVTVYWMNGTILKSKSLSSSLLNWQ